MICPEIYIQARGLLGKSLIPMIQLLIIIIIIIIIILSQGYRLCLPLFLEKSYTALFTESFHVSVTYLKPILDKSPTNLHLYYFLSSPSSFTTVSSVY